MGTKFSDRKKLLIAEEAARLVLEESVADYELARNKAARRYGVKGRANLPSPADIDQAVHARRALFGLRATSEQHRLLLQVALGWLQKFKLNHARLVGGLAEGIVTPESHVKIILVAESLKEVAIGLLNAGVDYQGVERVFSGATSPVPGFVLEDKGVEVELLVVAGFAEREALRDVRDGKGLKGVGAEQVSELIERLGS